MIRALLSGECQLSVQLENQDYSDAGLLFEPVTAIHEVALFINQPEMDSLQFCTLEDLAPSIVAFHNKRGYCLYEDALREHLAAAFPTTFVLEPTDFSRTNKEGDVALLTPSLQLPVRAAKYAVPLEWGESIKLGVLASSRPSEFVQDYVDGIKEYFANHPSLWL